MHVLMVFNKGRLINTPIYWAGKNDQNIEKQNVVEVFSGQAAIVSFLFTGYFWCVSEYSYICTPNEGV